MKLSNYKSILLVVILSIILILLLKDITPKKFRINHSSIVKRQIFNLPSENNYTDKQIWMSSDFKHHCGNNTCPYAVDIFYPQDYYFVCCGDMDTGTVHSLYLKLDNKGLSNLIDVIETSIDPRSFYKEKISNKYLKEIDNISTTNIGSSLMAVSLENTDYIYTNDNSYEEFLFKIKKQDGNMEFIRVKFYSPTNFTLEFKTEFLNKLIVWE